MSWNNASDWHSVNRTYSKSVKDGPLQFYSNLINNNPGNLKHLFSTLNHFLKPQPSSPIEATEERCNTHFLIAKVNNIHSRCPGIPLCLLLSWTLSLGARCLYSILLVSCRQSHTEEILSNMNPYTCALYPITTALLKSHISILSTQH